MAERIKTDLCVIGGGSGGLSVAAGAVQMGAKVVLIEGHKMGGDCLNVGCVPSKALIRSANALADVRDSGEFGISTTQDAPFDFPKIHGCLPDMCFCGGQRIVAPPSSLYLRPLRKFIQDYTKKKIYIVIPGFLLYCCKKNLFSMNNLPQMTFWCFPQVWRFFCQGYLAKVIDIEAAVVDFLTGNIHTTFTLLGDDGHWGREGCGGPISRLSVATA